MLGERGKRHLVLTFALGQLGILIASERDDDTLSRIDVATLKPGPFVLQRLWPHANDYVQVVEQQVLKVVPRTAISAGITKAAARGGRPA
jgi:hypothetical protein